MFSGSALPKSHHILTLRDLDDTRRPRRLSSRSRCSSSPSDSDPSAPMTLRSGGTIHARCSLFGSPPRSSSFGPASPPLSRQNSTSPVWSSPPRSNSSISAGISPRQGVITQSPRARQNFKITAPVSAEVPQDFLASSEAEDAAVATTNGISLAPDGLEEDVAHLMSQELPYTVFDTDTEVAVASMLNAKLEFDEALLAENVVLHCGGRGDVESSGQVVEVQEHEQEKDSEDEDRSHYLKFSRTVVCDAAGGSSVSPQLPSAQSISQLDGADSGSDSSEGEVSGDEVDESSFTPTKQLSVALKRLESSHTVLQEMTTAPECLENSAYLESVYTHDDMSLQEEHIVTSDDVSKSQNDVLLDPVTGHFVPSHLGSVVHQRNIYEYNMDDNSSSASDSGEVFKDDLKDPDYSPETSTKKLPTAQNNTNKKRPTIKVKTMVTNSSPIKQIINSTSPAVSPAAATFSPVQHTVTSPMTINGLKVVPTQSGNKSYKPIAIRINSSSQGQQQVTPDAANNASPATTPQVLLVNRQGQILLKDSKTNTYQMLSANSPTYNRISQIGKILHSGNFLQRSVPRFIIKSQTNASATNATLSPSLPPPAPVASNHTTPTEKKFIIRVLPFKGSPSSSASTSTPVTVQQVPQPVTPSKDVRDMAQDIIDRAMASHHNTEKPTPIILNRSQTPTAKHKRLYNIQKSQDSDQSAAAAPSASHSVFTGKPHFIPQFKSASTQPLVKVKRVSSSAERPSRKKSKLDLMTDPSSETEESNEARYETRILT